MAVIDDLINGVRGFSRRYLLERIAAFTSNLDDKPGRMQMIKWPRDRRGIRLPPQDIAVTTHSLATLTKIVLGHGSKWSNKIPTVEDTIKLQNQIKNTGLW